MNTNRVLFVLLFWMLTACAVSKPEYESSTPTFYRATGATATVYRQPKASAPGITLPRTQQVLVIGRKAPNWLVLKIDGAYYYVDIASVENAEQGNNYTPATPAYSPSSSGSSSRSIQTGPRGGKYYINKNGNKTYIKRR